MVVEAGAKFYGDIGGFAVGDTIDVTNLAPPGSSYFDPTTPSRCSTPGRPLRAARVKRSFSTRMEAAELTLRSPAFAAQILTDRGEMAIESLQIGAEVTTRTGAHKARQLSGDVARAIARLILIHKGAIAENDTGSVGLARASDVHRRDVDSGGIARERGVDRAGAGGRKRPTTWN